MENRLSQIEASTAKLEGELVQKDNEIVELQASFRSYHDEFTKKQIEFTDLESLAATYVKKNILGKKQLHSENCKTR